MRVILTTVDNARVEINNKKIASISLGYLLLVGFTQGDNKEIVEKMTDKILNLRVFPDEHDKINLSLQDVKGDILSVSQFTLYASSKGSRRPSFIDALNPAEAEELYNYFNSLLETKYGKVSTGIFGANMNVFSTNIGPFTLILDSKELFK